MSMKFKSIGQFEEEALNFGIALMESDLSVCPQTDSGHVIVEVL